MRVFRTASALALLSASCPGVTFGGAGIVAPIPVSPGAAEHEHAVAAACPTFSWSQASGATGYRLTVYEVSDLGWTSESPTIAVELPRGVSSWTPGADGCLEAGRRYVWRVRDLGAPERGEEPTPLMFGVRETAQESGRVEALLSDLASHLGVEVEELRRRLAGEPVPAEDPLSSSAATDPSTAHGSRDVAATTAVGLSGNFSGRVHAQSGGSWWADLAGPGIGGTGPTGVTGWGQTGMFGYGDATGVWGETGVASGIGVRGNAWAGGHGVYGYSGGGNYGVYGESASGTGVYGTVTNPSVLTAGVKGASTSGRGVVGESTSDIGVLGRSTSYIGVFGTVGTGFHHAIEGYGEGNSNGVHGSSDNAAGVTGTGATGVGGTGYNIGGSFMGGSYGIFVRGEDIANCDGCATYVPDAPGTTGSVPRRAGLPNRALIATDSGAFLTHGGNWVNSSDERRKENFSEIDRQDLLSRVDRLPIRTWNYIADGPTVRHIGPTAQDFQAAFGLGGGDTSISTVDPAGIALATIQALHRANVEQQRTIGDLSARLAALERQVMAAAPGDGTMVGPTRPEP